MCILWIRRCENDKPSQTAPYGIAMSTTLSDYDATDEPDDEDDECACEYGAPGCWQHYLENGGYDDE